MNNNLLDDSFNFDFSSYDNSNSDELSFSSESDYISMDKFSNDTVLNNKDTFDVGNLKSNNYNRDTIDKIQITKPSERENYLQDIHTVGDKKYSSKIEYTNNYSGEDSNSQEDTGVEFYDLRIDDYPERKIIQNPGRNNKSLGATDENFITRLINKIKSIFAR